MKQIYFSKKRNIIIFSFLLLLVVPFSLIFAQVMQSSTYQMESDTINFGGEYSSSANYNLNDTLGEIGTGDSNSANYAIKAGFWQMQGSYISISSPDDLALAAIGGIEGDASEGTLVWKVITDNSAGYSLDIKTTSDPALTSASDSFDDYTPIGANPDFNFSIPSTTSAFGFSPEGVDTDARFLDNGSSCNISTNEATGKCWDGLSTTAKTIMTRTTSNHVAGSDVTVRFRAESGADHIQAADSYYAPIIVTAVTL